MAWLWLTIGIGAPIFLAITGIPLWMMIRYPDTGAAFATCPAQGGPAPAATPGVAFPTRRPDSGLPRSRAASLWLPNP
jgi:hypothetical protein